MVSLLRSQQCYTHLRSCPAYMYQMMYPFYNAHPLLSSILWLCFLLSAAQIHFPWKAYPMSLVQVFQHLHSQPSSVPRSYGKLLHEDTLGNTSPGTAFRCVCPDSLMVFSDRGAVTHSLQHPWEELGTQYTLNKFNCVTDAEEAIRQHPNPLHTGL